MPVHIEKLSGTAFIAFPEMKALLSSELASRFNYGKLVDTATISGISFSADSIRWYGDLLYCPDFVCDKKGDEPVVPYWASTTLLEPFILRFDSIGEAARALKEIQRNWAPYQYQCFRRATLIQEKLPYINLKARKFPLNIPNTPMGVYTLLDEKTILASAVTSSPLPAGRIEFEEDHENPPSRAYLKLQESLTLAKTLLGAELPKEGSKCFEAGACPGGWTWVLRALGADVLAVDRAELATFLMKDSHVTFKAHDAFTLKPEEIASEFGAPDWVFSDVICYPERLLGWVKQWLESGLTKNMICTIKMQGAVDWSLVQQFADIPYSRVVHLNYNKHELTWIHCPPVE